MREPQPIHEHLPVPRRRRRPIVLPERLSDDELTRNWSLDTVDVDDLRGGFRSRYRLANALQLCTLRLFGRFLRDPTHAPPKIVAHLCVQLGQPAPLFVEAPERKATRSEHQGKLLELAGFQRFDETARDELTDWLDGEAHHGDLPATLFERAERRLLRTRIVLPAASTLDRLVNTVCNAAHAQLFESIVSGLAPELRRSIDSFLEAPPEDQRSFFGRLKEYPPSPTPAAMKRYLERYRELDEFFRLGFERPKINGAFAAYLAETARGYDATDLKRFRDPKRYALMTCFLSERRKTLLDHLVQMHDKYVLDMRRDAKSAHEEQYRALRKRQKRAIDAVLRTTHALLAWPEDEARTRDTFWDSAEEERLRESVEDLKQFQWVEEHGLGSRLVARYPTLRKYFAEFVRLPFAGEAGSEELLKAIQIVRQLDDGELKSLPANAPRSFVPGELRGALTGERPGSLNRNAWETGLAIALRDSLRSGDVYIPDSKEHVSFWDLLLSETRWGEEKEDSYDDLGHPTSDGVCDRLVGECEDALRRANGRYGVDRFARVESGKLKLRRDDTKKLPPSRLQQTIDASLPLVRVEQLLMDVDRATGFSRCFVPLEDHQSRPKQFYRSLLSAIISQATNLGVVSMSASVPKVTLDMLRRVLQHYVREETIQTANSVIVDAHHGLPLSSVHGDGETSSSDAQRFRIRADSLLASYYPRYFGYYEKGISIYTHISDQYSVFGTRAISCGPREALYVLDGLLNNNTILRPGKHTTDTDGYTEIIFGLCYLLGYFFMPRIKDLKSQQLYRPSGRRAEGDFGSLLKNTVDLDLIAEQWDPMMQIAWSLRLRTAPAHVVVQRLTLGSPHDRLSNAVRHLGRLVKTNYILRYCTDPELRRAVQRQLNKGEHRQGLSRWIHFADQGDFKTGDYIEIMNKASCLSLVSNAILYWNTVRIGQTVDRLRAEGEAIEDEELSHISLLPFKHVMPNGTYFIDTDDS